MPKTSRISGFYDIPLQARLARLAEALGHDPDWLASLGQPGVMTAEIADHMIENAVGVFGLPLGIALNFVVNQRPVLVPMAIEEPSIVAGASYMAKLVAQHGGFVAQATASEMIGQIQLMDLADLEAAQAAIEANREELLAQADQVDPLIKTLGGGARALEVRPLAMTAAGPMLIVHLIYDTRDAMGANAVNTALERLTPRVEEISGGRAHLRILSNLADRRTAQATCRLPAESLAFDRFEGIGVRDGIVAAWAFAEADPYRAATHNKGIMNGVDAVVLATGNDWRAVEAGAHAYASRSGRYLPLSQWRVGKDGALEGRLKMPMAVGTVGGATRVHPLAKACTQLIGAEHAGQLAEVIVSVGLAQNLAALRALATEGIQRGHMALHARQVAIAAGAARDAIEKIARQMAAEGEISLNRAQALLRALSASRGS